MGVHVSIPIQKVPRSLQQGACFHPNSKSATIPSTGCMFPSQFKKCHDPFNRVHVSIPTQKSATIPSTGCIFPSQLKKCHDPFNRVHVSIPTQKVPRSLQEGACFHPNSKSATIPSTGCMFPSQLKKCHDPFNM